jgi:putative membrane protein
MAGLLYLPRLFVYHSIQPGDTDTNQTFKTMERRLLRFIMRPAMISSWITGLFMAYYAKFYYELWFLAKFSMVVTMTIAHAYMAKLAVDFENDQNTKTQKFFRVLNEAPTVLMIGIVAMVIVKPF